MKRVFTQGQIPVGLECTLLRGRQHPALPGKEVGKGGKAPLAVFYSSIAAPCHRLPAPTGIQLPSGASPAAVGSQAANRLVEN